MMVDVQDLYLERSNDQAMDQYRVDNGWRQFATRTAVISVKPDSPAALRDARPPIKITLRRTMRGPALGDVIAQRVFDHPLTLRCTAPDPCDTSFEILFISVRIGSVNLNIARGQIKFIAGTDVGFYLRLLRFAPKVSIRAGRFSTLDLPDGQSKRPALLIAFLEDKELYLFDEWAADQDTEYKNVFHNQILPPRHHSKYYE